VILHYGKRRLFWSLKIFANLSFTTVWGQKNRFQQLWMYKTLNIANIYVFDVWGKRIFICNNKIFFLCIFMFIPFVTQLFSTPVTSSNLSNQAPLFTGNHLKTCEVASIRPISASNSFVAWMHFIVICEAKLFY